MVKLKTEPTYEEDEENGAQNEDDNDVNLRRIKKEIIMFHCMYVRLAAQKQGYFAGLRPIIGLDGCFLKTSMGGQLLCAVARDGNENMFPLAYAVVDIECKESWKWFLSVLFEDFGHPSETRWVFMSDKQKVSHLFFLCVLYMLCFQIKTFH